MIDVPLSYLYDPLPQCFLLGSLLHTTPEVFTPKSHKKKKLETTFIFKEKIFSTESATQSWSNKPLDSQVSGSTSFMCYLSW